MLIDLESNNRFFFMWIKPKLKQEKQSREASEGDLIKAFGFNRGVVLLTCYVVKIEIELDVEEGGNKILIR